MEKMTSIKKACITAVCIALCYALPIAFHSVGLGSVFSPMHIPVLLCGMVCGGGYGLFCGIAGPVLSSILSGMPTTTGLIFMVPELVTYGLVSGILTSLVHTNRLHLDMYISLAAAMVLGRIAGGIASAIFYMGTGQAFTIGIWAASYFAGSFPGIICHLILIPLLAFTLMKAKLIPVRYPNTAKTGA